MGRLLYFDPFNGASGDMILGALIDLGLPLEYLKSELSKLNLEGYAIEAEQIDRQGLQGINLKVVLNSIPNHSHEHKHDHHHHEDVHHERRGFTQIEQLIEKSELTTWVKERGIAIFRRLGEAEAKVHRTSLEEVHFHEVGAVDAIVDIVGACIGFDYFEVRQFWTAPISLGSGTVTFSHGTWPVPTPATAELVKGFPVLTDAVRGELTTPTGAAIVTTLVQQHGTQPICSYEKWGFGAGDRLFAEIPNMLRLILGDSLDSDADPKKAVFGKQLWLEEEVYVLEANIDDMDAETLGHFLELALSKGALDVYYTPLHMKKNRPGIKLSILCRLADRESMAELVFRETTTFGVRWGLWKRWILDREIRKIQTEFGDVRVKIGRLRNEIVSVAPEYEDLKRIAEKSNIPLKTLRQRVMEGMALKNHE